MNHFLLFHNNDDRQRSDFFMQEALKEARQAYREKEVPVGAVIVLDHTIIARAHNQTERLKDATAHAEMIAVTQAQSHIGDWRLNKATIYVTLEPCVMCTGALVLSRIGKIVYGAKDIRFGGIESLFAVAGTQKISPEIEIISGVCAAESAAILKKFFQERRKYGEDNSIGR